MRQFDFLSLLRTERGGEEEMSFFKQLRYDMRMMNDMHVMREKVFISRSFQHLYSKYQDNIN